MTGTVSLLVVWWRRVTYRTTPTAHPNAADAVRHMQQRRPRDWRWPR
jgi:hypothetical protein